MFKKKPLAGYIFIFLSIALNVSASILFKKSAIDYNSGLVNSLYFNQFYIGGICFLGVQTITWIYALRHVLLTIAYPMNSLIYPLGLFSGWLFFNEEIRLNNIVGIVVIMLGIIILNSKKIT